MGSNCLAGLRFIANPNLASVTVPCGLEPQRSGSYPTWLHILAGGYDNLSLIEENHLSSRVAVSSLWRSVPTAFSTWPGPSTHPPA